MKIEMTDFPGLLILYPDVYGDARGWFTESYQMERYASYGITTQFVQDNHSFSALKGTIRGLHFQLGEAAQSKLVRCISGSIWDVVVDLRKGSPTYLKWVAIELSAENHKQLFIPKGFAHGFMSLTDNVEIEYKVDTYYSKKLDSGIRYDDPNLNIDWKSKLQNQTPILSEKDLNLKTLNEIEIDFEFEAIK